MMTSFKQFYHGAKAIIALLLLSTTTCLVAKDIYISASSGSDSSGNGTVGKPYRTWTTGRSTAISGDRILLDSGEYGDIVEDNAGKDLFSGWVKIEAMPGKSPVVNSLRFGANVSMYRKDADNGVYNAYMQFDGIAFLDGISIYGARHVNIKNSSVQRIGPWTGSTANITKTGILLESCSYITISHCQISFCSIGLDMIRGSHYTIRDSDISNMANDGIHFTSTRYAIVDGCTIHNIDDGVADTDPESAGWGIHPDCIQVQIFGGARESLRENAFCIIRNCLIYGAEGQGIQFNNYLQTGADLHNRDFVIENNIFGPTNANNINAADPTDRVIVRHNTFKTGSYTFQSATGYVLTGATSSRLVTCSNSNFRMSSGTAGGGAALGGAIYNNLFANVVDYNSNSFFGYNVIYSAVTPTTANRTVVIEKAGSPFVNPSIIGDARLITTATAVNAGTSLHAPADPTWYTELLALNSLTPAATIVDFDGNPRDVRPDAGAYELQSSAAVAERDPLTAATPVKAVLFKEDFEDDDFNSDPYLGSAGCAGLSWNLSSLSSSSYVITNTFTAQRNALSGGPVSGEALLYSTIDGAFTDFQMDVKATNRYVVSGDGLALLVRDDANYYWLDIGRDTGVLYRFDKGEANNLATFIGSRLPHSGSAVYSITVKHRSDGIEFTVNKDGTNVGSYTDKSAAALANFPNGQVGFRRVAGSNLNLSVTYDDIQVLRQDPSSEPPTAISINAVIK